VIEILDMSTVETVLAIRNDTEFLKEATNLLEGMPYGIKKFKVQKLGNNGKGSLKMLYLSLAHGKRAFDLCQPY
jgi:hypothetical protein